MFGNKARQIRRDIEEIIDLQNKLKGTMDELAVAKADLALAIDEKNNSDIEWDNQYQIQLCKYATLEREHKLLLAKKKKKPSRKKK
jgi:predicted NUDIX family phosphoesterase